MRALWLVVCAPSIFEICVITYAAYRTRQFFLLWLLLALFTAAKFALKYVYLLRPAYVHQKTD